MNKALSQTLDKILERIGNIETEVSNLRAELRNSESRILESNNTQFDQLCHKLDAQPWSALYLISEKLDLIGEKLDAQPWSALYQIGLIGEKLDLIGEKLDAQPWSALYLISEKLDAYVRAQTLRPVEAHVSTEIDRLDSYLIYHVGQLKEAIEAAARAAEQKADLRLE